MVFLAPDLALIKGKGVFMKTIILTMALVLTTAVSQASQNIKEFKFLFKPANSITFEIRKQAATKDAAFKLAAKDCFNQLTGGKYPGEERGLDIIDICANPKM